MQFLLESNYLLEIRNVFNIWSLGIKTKIHFFWRELKRKRINNSILELHLSYPGNISGSKQAKQHAKSCLFKLNGSLFLVLSDVLCPMLSNAFWESIPKVNKNYRNSGEKRLGHILWQIKSLVTELMNHNLLDMKCSPPIAIPSWLRSEDWVIVNWNYCRFYR